MPYLTGDPKLQCFLDLLDIFCRRVREGGGRGMEGSAEWENEEEKGIDGRGRKDGSEREGKRAHAFCFFIFWQLY